MAKGKYEYWLTPEGLVKLEGWARDGLTDEQIAQNIGIVESTLYEWKNKYSEISESLKKGKEVVDYEVENALLKRALGYTVKEEKLTKDGEVVELERIYTMRELGYWPYVMIYDKEHTRSVDTVRRIQGWVNAKAAFETVKRFEDYKS